MTELVREWSTQPSFSLWRTTAGWILLILGVAGLMLPFLPGVPLLVAGLVMLSTQHRWARKCLGRMKLWIRKFHRRRPKPENAEPIMRRREESPGSRMERQPQPPTVSTKGDYHHETASH